jgi:hypothetical protein
MKIQVKKNLPVSDRTLDYDLVYSKAEIANQFAISYEITFNLEQGAADGSAGIIETEDISATWIYENGWMEISGLFHYAFFNSGFQLLGKGTMLTLHIVINFGALEIYTAKGNDFRAVK